MTTLLQQIPLPALEEIVEVLATRQALLFAKELRFEGLVMEGDSEIIINAIKGDNMNLSHYGHLPHDIKFLSSSFRDISFYHVRR